MPDAGPLLAFAATAFALIVVPGPRVLFVVGRAVSHGRRAALATVVGNVAGIYVQVLAVAVGLGAIVARSITVFTLVKLVGAAYLVVLGVRAIRQPSTGDPTDEVAHTRAGLTHAREGFFAGVANPKAIVFFAAILPQFVDPDGATPALQMAALGAVFVAIALVCDSVWGLLAGTARAWFGRSPQRLGRLQRLGGAVMVGLGLNLALAGRD